MPTRQSVLRCGYLLPRILLLWALLDIMLRFAPPQWYAFRLHEFAMVTGPHGMGPFRINFTYQNSHAYGDLASLGNCTDCRQYRAMDVHIDERGFANPASSGPYDAILVGDSFGVGAEQPGGETLAAQISQRTGLAVYNACSPVRAISRQNLLNLIDQLGMTHGTVFFELMDWSLSYYGAAQQDPRLHGLDRWSKAATYSPLANISRDLVGRLYDGRLMPNPYAANVVRKRLPDGRPILFQLDDVVDATSNAPHLWTRYFRELSKDLRQRNFRLIVILVPSKYTVYQSLIRDSRKTNKSQAFNELQQELRGIPVVNTTPALQQAASDHLKRGDLLYWSDDTHWNADGVRIAADQLQMQYASDFVGNPAAAKITAVSKKNSR
jgi:hypothetical protein